MRIFIMVSTLFCFVLHANAQSALTPLVQLSLGSSAQDLTSYAQKYRWQISPLTQTQLWQRAEAQAFVQFRSQMGSANLQLYAYRVEWFDQDVDIFFFFNQNRLFAINFAIPRLTEDQFVRLVQEMGGPLKDGFLGYGAPIWQDDSKDFLVYMWYLNGEFTQTLIMTYYGEKINPMLTIQIVDEKLGR